MQNKKYWIQTLLLGAVALLSTSVLNATEGYRYPNQRIVRADQASSSDIFYWSGSAWVWNWHEHQNKIWVQAYEGTVSKTARLTTGLVRENKVTNAGSFKTESITKVYYSSASQGVLSAPYEMKVTTTRTHWGGAVTQTTYTETNPAAVANAFAAEGTANTGVRTLAGTDITPGSLKVVHYDRQTVDLKVDITRELGFLYSVEVDVYGDGSVLSSHGPYYIETSPVITVVAPTGTSFNSVFAYAYGELNEITE